MSKYKVTLARSLFQTAIVVVEVDKPEDLDNILDLPLEDVVRNWQVEDVDDYEVVDWEETDEEADIVRATPIPSSEDLN